MHFGITININKAKRSPISRRSITFPGLICGLPGALLLYLAVNVAGQVVFEHIICAIEQSRETREPG
jgi:hypothetical protein